MDDTKTIALTAIASIAFISGTVLTAIQLSAGAPIAEILAVGGLTFGAGGTITGYIVGLHTDKPEGDQ